MNATDESAVACPTCGSEMCEDARHWPISRRSATQHPTAADAAAAAFERRVSRLTYDERARREARRRLDADARGPLQPIAFESLHARLARPRPEAVIYRIGAFQPCETRVMLAAQFKAGKTTLIGNLIRSLVDGDDFLGHHAVTPITGSAVLLDFEMSESQLDHWLAAQRILRDDRVFVMPLRGRAATFDILDATVRGAWADRLREVGCCYVLLDCLRPILDALGLDENHDAGRFLVAFDSLLAGAGVREALVVHHMGHLNERARGDSRLRDWPDCEWRLVRQGDDPSSPRFLAAYGRDVDVAESRLSFDAQTRHLTIAGGGRQDAAAQAALVDILNLSAEWIEGLSGRAIKMRLSDSGHVRTAIERALRLGVSTGVLAVHDGPKNAQLYRRVAQDVGKSGAEPKTS